MVYLSGFHAIEEKIKSGRSCGPLLVAKPGPRAKEIVDLAIAQKIAVNRVGTSDLDRLSPDHRGILLEAADDQGSEGPEIKLEDYLAGLGSSADALAVILDEITDPHNYGAILRSCDQFGAGIVITRKRRIAKYAQVIAQTSAGASAWVPTAEAPNLQRAVDLLKENGFWIYGADMEGEAAWDRDLTGRTAIIFGGEGSGISRILRDSCDAIISVPKAGRLDSLNVSVAAGILMYEVNRQRKKR
ncbi:MAG: 23S rRNA (guanosine(2251)-2'-O)-methyltransferase RlmB [Treponema sp.]|nr:23S rRNA (guanosine(2251)-2'-O)-methyltransferase RlmB [Treponema sp.]